MASSPSVSTLMWPKTCFTSCAIILLAALLSDGPKLVADDFTVLPSATDSAIDSFDKKHVFYEPKGPVRNQLLLFLPGTHSRPIDAGLQAFVECAAEQGFHAVGLMYPDGVSAQTRSNDKDEDAYLKFRLAIIEGRESPHMSVSRANSIENRLIKLLVYLQNTRPAGGWGQYLNARREILWEHIAVGGHSQGGGQAVIIAKFHKVARVLMFGSPKDFSHHFHAPAKGFDADTKTPHQRYFAFNHVKDDKAGCSHDEQMAIFKSMKLLRLGSADVDGAKPPYNNAHLLFTHCPVSDVNEAHASVFRITDADGNRHFKPVWTYMLTAPLE